MKTIMLLLGLVMACQFSHGQIMSQIDPPGPMQQYAWNAQSANMTAYITGTCGRSNRRGGVQVNIYMSDCIFQWSAGVRSSVADYGLAAKGWVVEPWTPMNDKTVTVFIDMFCPTTQGGQLSWFRSDNVDDFC